MRSVSGQFTAVAVGLAAARTAAPTVLETPGGFIVNPGTPAAATEEASLDPALLVISCERIKQSLLLTLGLPDQWRGRVGIFIAPARPQEEGTLLTGMHGGNGWNYELTLPSPIQRRLLVRAVVKALLTEMANRAAGEQSAEIPDWLVAGLSGRLQADGFQELVLQPQISTVGNRLNFGGAEALREQLRRRPALSFQELSWPGAETVAGENYEFFAACSQLFVEQLLRLDDGRSGLRDFVLRQLPRHLNWQTAFLEAYPRHFSQLLDVEKWWGLSCVSFAGTDASARFGEEETWKKLQETLDVPVEVRLSAEALPAPAELTLQEVITDWDAAEAAPVLQHAAAGLALLRMQCAPEFASLIDRYRAALGSYLSDTLGNRPAWTSNHQVTMLASVRYSVCKELARLDQQRAALRPGRVGSATPAAKGSLGAPRPPVQVGSFINNRP
jgi:hypothetical protein